MSPRIRPETFGAIVSSEDPPLLAHVDRELAMELGLKRNRLWQDPQPELTPLKAPILSAPTEVHLLLEGRCPARCKHCYVDAHPDAPAGLPFQDIKKTLDSLAAMGVFHVALGGGESLMRADLFEVAAYARSCGLIPNLTLSGMGFNESDADQYRIFGQVNVSIDGLGALHRAVRGDTSFKRAARCLTSLLGAGVRAGINHVLTKPAYDSLEELVAWAVEIGAIEVEILRLKPVGRCTGETYTTLRLSDSQHRTLFPKVMAIAKQHNLHLKLDCSFAPMIFWHDPDPEVVHAFNILGCDGGNSLGAILTDGTLAGCSFYPKGHPGRGESIDTHWDNDNNRLKFRHWPATAPEPCNSCSWRGLCQGGCHAVAEGTGSGFTKPDPECPRVIRHHNSIT